VNRQDAKDAKNHDGLSRVLTTAKKTPSALLLAILASWRFKTVFVAAILRTAWRFLVFAPGA
jgi:hypothetical protein